MTARRWLLLACRLGLGAWLLVVLAALHAPAPSAVPASEAVYTEIGGLLPDAPGWLDGLIGDKTIHVALFAPLGWLWTACQRLARRPVRWVAVGLVVLATASELLQVLGGRITDPADVAADLLGGLLGAAGVQAVGSARRWRRQRAGRGEAAPLEQGGAEQQR